MSCQIIKGCKGSLRTQCRIWLHYKIGMLKFIPIDWIPQSWLPDWGCYAYAEEEGGCTECNPDPAPQSPPEVK